MAAYRIPDNHSHDHEESESFAAIVSLPDDAYSSAYDRLIGLDHIKEQLLRDSTAVMKPQSLTDWSEREYGCRLPAVDVLQSLSPMFIFAGDVGTGKTALAESFGSRLAEQLDIAVQLYRLSFSVRGNGLVGEMSTLIERAFRVILDDAHHSAVPGKSAYVLVIDEADTLAQSRDANEMHHEDRAGVNTLIRGLDAMNHNIRLIVVLCTNRLDALDPAVMRRARAVFRFERPDRAQRRQLFANLLAGSDLTGSDLDIVADATELANGCRFTYSDIANRIVAEAVLKAWPNSRLTTQMLLDAIAQIAPSPSLAGVQPELAIR